MSKHILLAVVLLATLRLDAQITRQWVATHNGQGDFNDRFTCVIRDPAGNYYLGGSTVNPGTDRDFLVLKTDPAGNTLWMLQLDGSGQAADEVSSLALAPSGDLIATGISKGENTSEDFLTLKVNASGDTLWSRRYDYIGEYDQPNALAVDAAGNILVTGLSDGDSGAGENDDYLTLKYDPNGNLLWANRYNGLGDAIDRAVGIAANAAGQVFVSGRSDNGQNDDFVTICYDASGVQQWIKLDDRGDRDRATALTLDAEGNLLIAGQSSNGDNDDFWTLKYTPAGTLLWQKSYDFV
ncbi:MAG: SBBP repeat-containing protein, partial [Saprospiraceae bacterium]